jgi:DNA polymerase III alpha subunit
VAKLAEIRFVVGARLDLGDAPSLLCFPTDRAAYGRLSRLLTIGRRRAPKGECHIGLADVIAHGEGQILVALPPEEMTRDKAEADIIKVKVEKDASEVAVQAAEVKAAKDDVQKDLDVAMPALNAAKLALAKLDKKDIQEVKSFAKPPPAVVVVLEAVCLLLPFRLLIGTRATTNAAPSA